MRNRHNFKNHQQESRLFIGRCIVAVIAVLALTMVIIIRLAYLQISEHQFYTTQSQKNILNIIPIKPNRGLIYDRNGVLLAKDIPTFTLNITPGYVKNLNNTIERLQKIIPISNQDIIAFRHAITEHHRYQPTAIKFKLTESQRDQFYVNRYQFPGVSISSSMIRYYPLGKVTSSVVGYVGRINAQELSHVNAENYSATNYIGKTGIEKEFEQALHGSIGAEEAEINSSGRIVRVLKRIAPVPGENIYLTIDSKLQAYAEKVLGNNAGAIVAIQPSTGQVLALATKPDYNPNAFVTGLSEKAYKKLTDNPNHPLYNRAIRGLYAPGSTVKPFYAIAGLDSGVITKNYKIFDKGWFRLPGTHHTFHDWKWNGHGWVNVTKAIMVSCDTFFYNLANMMGITHMDEALKAFGFGHVTGINMPDEYPGIVPSPAWKLKHKGSPWYTGDTLITGIGQGSLLVTPLQLASAVSIIADRGEHFKPTIILKTVNANGQQHIQLPDEETPVILRHPSVWHTVIHAMEQVVSNPYGTAEAFGRNPGYSVAAKTGTAQVFGIYRDEERDRTNIPKHLRNNHLFIMFAPVKHPKIALAVVIEHAGFEDRVARKVTDFYFKELKQEKIKQEQKQEQQHGS